MLAQLWIVVQRGHSHYQGDRGESPDPPRDSVTMSPPNGAFDSNSDFVALRNVFCSVSNFDYDGFTSVPNLPFGTLLTFLLLRVFTKSL